jgi:hypothetical protein
VVKEGAVWPLQPAVYDIIRSDVLQEGAGVYCVWIIILYHVLYCTVPCMDILHHAWYE